jgi:hypothetical protein
MINNAIAAFKNNPRRAPHWRWLRAAQIDSGGIKASKHRDGEEGYAWIRRALRLKRHYDRAGGRAENMYALALRDGDLFWAHSIWVDDKAPTRWSIEARVVAQESDEEIAQKLGTDPGVINAYVNTFFDVRGKLTNMDYVINVIMADAVVRGLQERHYDLLWKMMAFNGGSHVLDAVINKFIPIVKPDSPDGVGGFFQDSAINMMKYKASLASLTVPVNTHTQLPLIDSFVKYVEVERTTDNATKAQHSIIDNIGAMLTAMPVKIGTKLDSADVKMLPFDNGPAELRGDEMLIIASGGKVDNAAEIQNLNFPGDK